MAIGALPPVIRSPAVDLAPLNLALIAMVATHTTNRFFQQGYFVGGFGAVGSSVADAGMLQYIVGSPGYVAVRTDPENQPQYLVSE